jgi:hypothetical protein
LLKQIDVVYGNESGEHALALPIADLTPKDSVLLRKVTGLNPPDIDLFIGDYSRDGGIYQGRRVGVRNVVLTMDLNPNPALGETVSGLRELLYKTFVDPQVTADYSQIILREDDGRSRYLVGYAEKFETDIFGIETLAQISLLCPDPYIRDLVETVLTDPVGWLTVPFAYAGTAETGFEVGIAINLATEVVTLANNGRTMVIEYPFEPGDEIYMNTNRGSRAITLTRVGVTTPLIAQLSPASRWLELHSQANSMTVYGDITANRPASIKSLTYTAAYWGV